MGRTYDDRDYHSSGSIHARATVSAKPVSIWKALPGFRESLPGAVAMIVIAVFCGLPGIPWPFTIHNLLGYLDQVLPPIYGKGLFIDLLHFNYVVIGLVIGMVIRNFIGVPRSWEAGLSFTPVLMNAASSCSAPSTCFGISSASAAAPSS